jgi:hypothetical protein
MLSFETLKLGNFGVTTMLLGALAFSGTKSSPGVSHVHANPGQLKRQKSTTVRIEIKIG